MRLKLLSALMALVPLAGARAGERFACNAKALSPTERLRYQELTRQLTAAMQEKVELKDGYGFRLPTGSLMTAAEWASFERRCCPFFTFVLEQVRDEGPVWLRLTGSDGVKRFIRTELQL
jgi:hypothetical protein